MKELLDMLNKGNKPEMSEMEKKAKMEVIQELLEYAMSMSGEDYASGMQELTISAPDKEGMMEGMDTAEDMMEEMPMEMPMEDSDMEEYEEEDEEEDEEDS